MRAKGSQNKQDGRPGICRGCPYRGTDSDTLVHKLAGASHNDAILSTGGIAFFSEKAGFLVWAAVPAGLPAGRLKLEAYFAILSVERT
jgi:hypothetical protein